MGIPLLLLGAYAASAKTKGDRKRRERADAAFQQAEKDRFNNEIVYTMQDPRTGNFEIGLLPGGARYNTLKESGWQTVQAGTRKAIMENPYTPERTNQFAGLYMDKNRQTRLASELTQGEMNSGNWTEVGKVNLSTNERTMHSGVLSSLSSWFNKDDPTISSPDYIYTTTMGPRTAAEADGLGLEYDSTKPIGYMDIQNEQFVPNFFTGDDLARISGTSNKTTTVNSYIVSFPTGDVQSFETQGEAFNAAKGNPGAKIAIKTQETDVTGQPIGNPTLTNIDLAKAEKADEPEKVVRTLIELDGRTQYVTADNIPEGATNIGQQEGVVGEDGSFKPTGELKYAPDAPKPDVDAATQLQFKVGPTTVYIPSGDLANRFNSIVTQFNRNPDLKAAFNDSANPEVDDALDTLVQLIEQEKSAYIGGGGTDFLQAYKGQTFVDFARSQLGDNVLVVIPGLKQKLEERDKGILASEKASVEAGAGEGKARTVATGPTVDGQSPTITFTEYPESQRPFVENKLLPTLAAAYPNKLPEEIKFELNLNYSSPSGETNGNFKYLASLSTQTYSTLENMSKFDYLIRMTDSTDGGKYINNEFGKDISGSYSQYTQRNPRIGVSLLRSLIPGGATQFAMANSRFQILTEPAKLIDFQTKNQEQAQSAIAAKATMQGFLNTYLIPDPENPGTYLRDPETNTYILRPSTGVLDTRAIIRGARYTFGALADYILPNNGGVRAREAVDAARGQLNSLYYNVFTTDEEKAQVEAGKAEMDAIMAEIESETDAATAERKLYMVMTAYQIAATIQGGTGGRTISDQDVALIFRALSQNFLSTGPDAEVKAILAAYEFVDMLGYRAEVLSDMSNLRDVAALAFHDRISNATGALNFDTATTGQLINALLPNAEDIKNRKDNNKNNDPEGSVNVTELTDDQITLILNNSQYLTEDGTKFDRIEDMPPDVYAQALKMSSIPFRPQPTSDNSTGGNQ